MRFTEHARRASGAAALVLMAALPMHAQMSIGVYAGLVSGSVCSSSTTDQIGSIGNLCPAAQAKLNAPRTVYIDPNTGNVFIADYGDSEMREVYQSGSNELARLVAAYNNSAVVSSGSVVAGDIYNGCGAYSGSFTSISTAGGSCGNTKLTPAGIGMDSGGNLVEDEGGARMRVIYTGGTAITTLINDTLGQAGTVSAKSGYEYVLMYGEANAYYGDGGNALAALVSSAKGVWIDSNENIYIADYGNHAIRKITGSTGIISTIAGTGCTQATVSAYVTVGTLTNTVPNTVSAAGGCTSGAATSGVPALSANLNHPYDVVMDANGNLYIADYGNAVVRAIYEGSGSIPGVSSPQLGYIYTVAGGGTTTSSGSAATATQFSSVSGLGFDASGNLYIADAVANQIWEVTKSTQIATVIAGGGTTITEATCSTDGYGDGCVATQAVLNGPMGRIAVDSSSHLYFAENGNNFVRVLKPYAQGTTSQTVNFPAPTTPVNYSATPITVSATASSGLPVSFTVSGPATISGTTITLTGTGTVTVTASQAGNAVYAAAQAQRTIQVVANALTVSATGTFSRIFGTANPNYGFTVTGFIGGDTQGSVITGAPVITTTATPKSAAGTYPITIAQGTLAANSSNSYVFAMNASQSLTVTGGAAQSIIFPPLANYPNNSNVYLPLAAYTTSGLPVSYAVTSGPASISGTNLVVTGTGTVTVQATQAGNTSFAAATPVSQSFSAQATNCSVFDNSYFQGKPSVVDQVLTRSDVVYSNKIWTSGNNTASGELTLPTRASFDALMSSGSYNDAGPLVLDIEEIGLQTQAAETVLQTIAQWAHQDKPGRIVGFYGYNVFDAVTTSSSNFSLAQQLAQYVDAFFPEAYTNYADYKETSWLTQEQTRIANARAIGPGKPVYPYIWPIYYANTLDQNNNNIGGTYVDSTYWNYELTNLYPLTDGVVIWSSSSNVWSDATGWWEVTTAYVTNSCP